MSTTPSTVPDHHTQIASHYRSQQDKASQGWQQSVPVAERAHPALQFFTYYRFLNPKSTEDVAIRNAIQFETQAFNASQTKDRYMSKLKSQLVIMQTARDAQTLKNLANGMSYVPRNPVQPQGSTPGQPLVSERNIGHRGMDPISLHPGATGSFGSVSQAGPMMAGMQPGVGPSAAALLHLQPEQAGLTMPVMQPEVRPSAHALSHLQQQQQVQAAQMQARMRVIQQQGGAQMSPGQNVTPQQLALLKANNHIQQQGVPPGENAKAYKNLLAQQYYRQIQQQQQQQQQQAGNMGQQNQGGIPSQQPVPNAQANKMANMQTIQQNLQDLKNQYTSRRQQLMRHFGNPQNFPQQFQQQMHQLEMAIRTEERELQQRQHAVNPNQTPHNMIGNMKMMNIANNQGIANIGGQNMQQQQMIAMQHSLPQESNHSPSGSQGPRTTT